MKRALFDIYYPADATPNWPCPNDDCAHGILRPQEDAKLKDNSRASMGLLDYDGYHPEFDHGLYAEILKCTACGDVVSATGRWGHEEWEFRDSFDHTECRYPKFFLPPLPMIDIPPACGQLVKNALGEAFGAYWSSPGNAANSIRIALERLLDDLGVAKERLDRKRKLNPLTLHARIEEYREKSPGSVADYLEAAKWVGNAGSHQGTVDHAAILDVLELVEHVLAEIFPKDRSRLDAKAAAIIAAKGPA